MTLTIDIQTATNIEAGPTALDTAGGAFNWQNVPVQSTENLVIPFTGTITAGPGGANDVVLLARGNNGYQAAESFDISDTSGGPGTVSIVGNTLVIRPTVERIPLREYKVLISPNALNEFDGITLVETSPVIRIDRGFIMPSLDPADYSTVIDGQTYTGSGIGLDINDQSFVFVTNCSISSSNDTGARVGNSSDIVFYQCTFQNISNFGAQLRDSSGNGSARVYFIECDFRNVQSDGIQIPQAADIGEDNPDCVVINCTFENVALRDSGAGKHHVYTQGTNNMVLDCTLRGLSDANGISIRSDGIVHNNDVRIHSLRHPSAGACIKYFSDHRTGPKKRLIIAYNHCDGDATEDMFAAIDLDRTTSNQFGSDEDWVVNDFYLLGNTYGTRLTNQRVFDQALEDLPFVSITEYAA